jgi:ribosomal protein S18 acetylase RimI-like enzyme
VLAEAARNHRSWFGRGRERIELDGITVFLASGDALLAFPEARADLASAVRLARDAGAREISCWGLEPDDELGERLTGLGFQDGWWPHWMGVDPRHQPREPVHPVEETTACLEDLPYASEHHASVLGGDVRHFVVRDGTNVVGHAVLNVDGESGGIYDMGVAPQSRRQGFGRALTTAALSCAREEGCASVTLNATAEGELLYRAVGFESLGYGMTWWLFPGRSPASGTARA